MFPLRPRRNTPTSQVEVDELSWKDAAGGLASADTFCKRVPRNMYSAAYEIRTRDKVTKVLSHFFRCVCFRFGDTGLA